MSKMVDKAARKPYTKTVDKTKPTHTPLGAKTMSLNLDIATPSANPTAASLTQPLTTPGFDTRAKAFRTHLKTAVNADRNIAADVRAMFDENDSLAAMQHLFSVEVGAVKYNVGDRAYASIKTTVAAAGRECGYKVVFKANDSATRKENAEHGTTRVLVTITAIAAREADPDAKAGNDTRQSAQHRAGVHGDSREAVNAANNASENVETPRGEADNSGDNATSHRVVDASETLSQDELIAIVKNRSSAARAELFIAVLGGMRDADLRAVYNALKDEAAHRQANRGLTQAAA